PACPGTPPLRDRYSFPTRRSSDLADILTIYLRLERKGDKLNMSYWTYDDTNPQGRTKNTLLQPVANRTFTDGGKFYQRKVTNTRFGIFRGNATCRELRLLGVYMYELLAR